MAALQTSGLETALKALDVKPDVIDKVVSTLTNSSHGLSDGSFETDANVPIASFGQRSSAHQFGVHYQKAQQVMQATIDGMAQDLLDFASNAKTAITYVNDADGTSKVDLTQAQQAVENLNGINLNSQADANHDESRNSAGGS